MSFWDDCWDGCLPISRRRRRSSSAFRLKDYEAGIQRRYEHHEQEEGSTEHTELKIRIRATEQDNKAKVFAVEATNVLPVLRVRCSVDFGKKMASVQLRTKHLRTKARGRSGKICISPTSVLKFPYESKNCIQTMTISKLEEGQIRFRLYKVFRRKKDVLLGEYVLDIPFLNLDIRKHRINLFDVIMELHESGSKHIKPPRVLDLQSSMRERSGANMQFNEEDDSCHPLLQEVQSNRQGLSDFGRSRDLIESTELRTEAVHNLSSKTDEMRSNARGFRDLCIRIRQQKEKKARKC